MPGGRAHWPVQSTAMALLLAEVPGGLDWTRDRTQTRAAERQQREGLPGRLQPKNRVWLWVGRLMAVCGRRAEVGQDG